MKISRNVIIVLLVLLAALPTTAQIVSFEKNEDTIYATPGKSSFFKVPIKCTGCKSPSVIKTVVKKGQSGYPDSLFNIHSKDTVTFNNGLANAAVVVEVNHNEIASGKAILLSLKNTSDSLVQDKYFYLYVLDKSRYIKLDSMKYRFMIGTNFDFVDGVQAKNLYYHLQVFQPVAFSKRVGFIGGIQQNRLVSQTDTLFPQTTEMKSNYFRDSLRHAIYSNVGSDSFRITRLDSVKYNQVSTATVFQIYIEPTVKLFSTGDDWHSKTEILGFLHGDIQFRKTKYEESFTYKIKDTVTVGRSGRSKYFPIPNGTKITSVNTYQFNYGIGALLHHENKYIDLYSKFMIGWATVARKRNLGFYGAELGIRVPAINIMLGAEYRGIMKEHNPTYFHVYLSKVFSLSKLADLLIK